MVRSLRLSSELHGIPEQPELHEILFQNTRKEMPAFSSFSVIKSPSSEMLQGKGDNKETREIPYEM